MGDDVTHDDPTDEAHPPAVQRGLRRWLLFVAGFVALALGAIGVVVPVLPTTPFVLVAAYCFARSSPRMHQRLIESRVFGQLIVDWTEHRSIPARAKVLAVSMIVASGSLAIYLLDKLWMRVALACVFVTVITWLLTRPTSPR